MSNTPAINLKDPGSIGVISPAYRNATRCQYGHYYTEDGTYLFSVEDEVEMAVKLGHTRKAASIVTHDDVAAEGTTADDIDPAEDDASGEVDLDAWLKGDAKYPFFKVKAAVTAKYGVTPANRREAEDVIKEPPQYDV